MRVADLTIEELRRIIKGIMDEKLREFLFDPDEGLELQKKIGDSPHFAVFMDPNLFILDVLISNWFQRPKNLQLLTFSFRLIL